MKYKVETIRRERIVRGWSQTRLAELAGVCPATINAIEHGRAGKPSTIRKLADLLNLDMRDLLIEETEQATA